MNDKQIIHLLFARSEQALDVLAQQFGPRLLQTATNILQSHRDAEECVNDTYLVVWNAIPPRKPDPLAGFVYKIGRNIALKRLRDDSAQKRNSRYNLSLDELAYCFGEDSLDKTISAQELGRAIDRFLDTVSHDSRVIFLRRYWFGDGIKDIAKILGYSENAVSVRLNRTRSKLRAYLEKEGYL